MTKYFAIDPAGEKHTRSTKARTYTHTVVILPSYEHDLASAKAAHHPKQDGRNFDYYTRIASGNDPYPNKCYRADHPGKWTPEEIEEERVRVDAENARRQRDAIETLAGRTVAQYLDDQLADRIAQVEKRKAEGYYERWQNAGWCGRLALAQTLLGSQQARAWVKRAVILDAQVK